MMKYVTRAIAYMAVFSVLYFALSRSAALDNTLVLFLSIVGGFTAANLLEYWQRRRR